MATATIQATPQRIQPGGTVTVDVTYSLDPGEPTPNDVHVEYQLLGSRSWVHGHGPDIPAGVTPGSSRVSFPAPDDEGTYDIRVRWTFNGDTLVTRTGQFFADNHATAVAPLVAPCPCKVELYRIPVQGGSSVTILQWLAEVLIDNPDDLTLFHSALCVQMPEGVECPTYSIELTDTCEDDAESRVKGERLRGGVILLPGFIDVYGIRAWRQGHIVDHEHALPPNLLSNDCAIAARLLSLVGEIPPLDYGERRGGDRWTSNSAVSWLLARVGLNPGQIPPPPDGMTPGWNAGINQAR
jgi:hypothetical protein